MDFEPHSALFAGNDGLDDIRIITQQVSQWLAPGGMVIVEMGYTQADAVRVLFEHAGLVNIETHLDLSGKSRFTAGYTAN